MKMTGNTEGSRIISTADILQIMFFVLTVAVLLTLSYYAHKYTRKNVNLEEIPLITANNTDLRYKPDNPGGVIFSNQDKEIYKSIAKTESKAQEEVHIKNNEDMATVLSQIMEPEEEDLEALEDESLTNIALSTNTKGTENAEESSATIKTQTQTAVKAGPAATTSQPKKNIFALSNSQKNQKKE